MKKVTILMFVCLLAFCGTAWAEKFPDLGECTGNSVRLREEPDTEAEIIGKVDKYDTFVLLDVKKVNNQKWYLIDHPTKKGNAWIFGKYVKKYYKLKDSEHIPAHVIAMQLRLDYGITPEKTRALHGKPLDVVRDAYGNFCGLKYEGFELDYNYDDDPEKMCLHSVSVGFEDGEDTSKAKFGPIKVGDDTKKLREVLGKYIELGEIFCQCDIPSGEVMWFNIEDDKVSSMQWLIEEH